MAKFVRVSEIGRCIVSTIVNGKMWPQELIRWGESHEANRRVLDRLGSEKELGQALGEFMSADPIRAQAEFVRRIRARRSAMRWQRAKVFAAASAAVVLLGWGGWELLPGKTAAEELPEIILADGSRMTLDAGTLEGRGGVSVAVAQTGERELVYTAEEPTQERVSADKPIEYHTLVMPPRASYKLQLSDGTKIQLNGSSRLRYPIAFGDGERRVYLQGEAFFEVAHNARQRFVVCAGEAEIRVHGTRFNVEWQGSNLVRTVLEEGLVEIGHRGEEGVMVNPGQVAEYNQTTRACRVMQADVEESASWRSDEFFFSNRSLSDIMGRMKQWYGLEFEFDDPSMAADRFTLMTPRYDDPEEVLKLLEKSSRDLSFHLSNDVIHVRKKRN